MRILPVYSPRHKTTVYKIEFTVNARRFRGTYFSEAAARENYIRLQEQARELTKWVPVAPEDEILLVYGWGNDINALPRIGAVYMIVPEPILQNVLYIGNTQNLWSRLRKKGHPWIVAQQMYPTAWITYLPMPDRYQRNVVELAMIRAHRPPLNIHGLQNQIDFEQALRNFHVQFGYRPDEDAATP